MPPGVVETQHVMPVLRTTLVSLQVEAAGLRADLLALRQFHLRSRALSTIGSEAGSWGSDEEEEEEEEEGEALSEAYRPSRQSRYAVATHGTTCCFECIFHVGQHYTFF